MKFTVERNWVEMIGPIWMPATVCAMRKDLSDYDVRNITKTARELFGSDVITREAIEHWLSLNSGGFQGIDDFSVVIGETEFPWADEESRFTYSDLLKTLD